MIMKDIQRLLAAVVVATVAVSTAEVRAAASSNDYNFDGVKHYLQDINLWVSATSLKDGDFKNFGPSISNSTNGPRFQGIEGLSTPDGTLYYSWGTDGYLSGFVWLYHMNARPTIYSSARAGNGKSAPDIIAANGARKSYYITPTAISSNITFVGPTDGKTRGFHTYGQPGASRGYPNYTYLTWSWVNKGGGGIVRTVMQKNEVFYPSDVATITMSSTTASGSVKAMYGFTYQGGVRLYGWTVHSHTEGGTYYPHIVCLNC